MIRENGSGKKLAYPITETRDTGEGPQNPRPRKLGLLRLESQRPTTQIFNTKAPNFF